MKYFAILKDSFFETIDYKLFYILIGLSLALSLVCASFTFPRLPPQKVLENNLKNEFNVSDVVTVEPAPFTNNGRYRFVLVPTRSENLASRLLGQIQLSDRIKDMVRRQLLQNDDRAVLPAFDPAAPAEPPRNALEWGNLVRDYLYTVRGLREVTVLSVESQGAGPPSRVEAEATIHWPEIPSSHKIGFLFGAWTRDLDEVPMGLVLVGIQAVLIDGVAGWVGIIITVIVTAGFVPNMLRKGTVDLLLTKPVSRSALLVYKYLGGLAFVFINALVLVGGTYVVFGFTTGTWSPWYLTSVFTLTFYFAILYSLSVLVGVVTRSQLAAILITIGFWFVLFLVNRTYLFVHPSEELARAVPIANATKDLPRAVVKTVDVVHFILPKPSDLSLLNQSLLARASGMEEMMLQQEKMLEKFSWSETLATSLGFIIVMLGISCWRFARTDY